MLNRLSGQDLINRNLVQSGEVEKTTLSQNNPYANVDKNLLIDETDISKEAFNLYQKDLDIKKFTALAMSDPMNQDCNTLVMENVFSSLDDSFNDKIIEGIFSNKTFLKDIFG